MDEIKQFSTWRKEYESGSLSTSNPQLAPAAPPSVRVASRHVHYREDSEDEDSGDEGKSEGAQPQQTPSQSQPAITPEQFFSQPPSKRHKHKGTIPTTGEFMRQHGSDSDDSDDQLFGQGSASGQSAAQSSNCS